MGGSDTPTVSLSRGTLTSMIMAAVLCVLVWLLFGIQSEYNIKIIYFRISGFVAISERNHVLFELPSIWYVNLFQTAEIV